MTSSFNLISALTDLKKAAYRNFHRHLVVISGNEQWVKDTLLSLLAVNSNDALYISNHPLGPLSPVPNSQLQHHLGKEYSGLIFDGFCGLDPNSLGIASGLLKGGNLFYLLLPPLAELADQPDRSYVNICHSDAEFNQLNTFFLARLKKSLLKDPNVFFISQDIPLHPAQYEASETPRAGMRLPTQDQLQTIESIKKVAFGHRHRPLVITADRGRGKTSALGIAAAEIWLSTRRNIFITAPNRQACHSAFEHFHATLLEHSKECSNSSSNEGLTFIALDALEELDSGSLLFVDEAAAIPVSILSKLLNLSSRIVFASTIHGYEGHGRGFAIRFEKILDKTRPGWQKTTLTTPIRWAENDPVETFFNHALLLGCSTHHGEEIKPLALLNKNKIEACSVSCLSQHDLANNETLLSDVFSLLVSAHYQTSPSDIRFILDHPRVMIYIAQHKHNNNPIDNSQQDSILGVCLVIKEGGLNDVNLFDGLISGQRRLRGQLFPQTLAMSSAEPAFLEHHSYRIMRIAVEPNYQQVKIGSRLLGYIAQEARKNQIDSLSTSYGMSEDLLKFWQFNDFHAVKLGFKKEGASGLNSVLMMRPLSEASTVIFRERQTEFFEELIFNLRSYQQHLDCCLVQRLLQRNETKAIALSSRDMRKLQAFAKGKRAYEETERLIHRFIIEMLPQKGWQVLSNAQQTLLIMRVLQNRSAKDLLTELNLSGKKQVDNALRDALASLLKIEKIN